MMNSPVPKQKITGENYVSHSGRDTIANTGLKQNITQMKINARCAQFYT
jgi:hypothetical protein